jgi:hypothetical protein
MRYQRINNFLGGPEQDNLSQPTATIPFTTEDVQTGAPAMMPAANPMASMVPAATTAQPTPENETQSMRQDIIAQMAQPTLEQQPADQQPAVVELEEPPAAKKTAAPRK